jgi:hypothetical protein
MAGVLKNGAMQKQVQKIHSFALLHFALRKVVCLMNKNSVAK